MRLCLLIPLVGLLATACASAQAKGSPDKPGLSVPPAPPHQIELPAEPLEPVGEIPGPAAPPVKAGRPAPREAPPKTDAPKGTDTKPDAAAPAPPAATNPEPAPALPSAPTPQLKTPQTDTDAAAKAVRSTIDHARNTLGTVNFGPLSNERKKAYNDAKLFLQQAEDALKEGNIVFAQASASKAEILAKELAGR